MAEIKLEWQIAAELGEGPLWVAAENALYWVDIKLRNVHRLSISTGEKKSWNFDTAVTSLATRKKGGFIATISDGYAFIDFETGKLDPVQLAEKDIVQNRFNDGKLDAKGRYWAGSMDDNEQRATGALYRLAGDLSIKKMDEGYIISNGPAYSADNKTMYHTDTRRKVVYAFDFDIDSGAIRNKRNFIELTTDEEGSPDGMTVDCENCLWLCHFGGKRITRYSAQGKVIRVYDMPVPNITSCTLGGPQLDTLYITTARIHLNDEQLDRYPLSGSLFSLKPGVKGLSTPLFAG